MDRLIYTTLSAMRGAMARQATTANNLANVSTTGFRGELANVSPLWLTGPGEPDRVFASEEVTAADTASGPVTQTGRPLDVAMSGDVMLAVQADDGEESYTRRGDLSVADSGLMTTGDGPPVMGDGGANTLPPYDSVRIAADGGIWIVPAGGDPANPQQVERLKLAATNGVALVKHVDGLFRVPGGGVLSADPQGAVTSGALEGSNVDPTRALVAMIDASRHWDSQLKLLTSARDLDSATTNLMKLPA